MTTILVPDKVDMYANNDNDVSVRLFDKKAKMFFDGTATATVKLINVSGDIMQETALVFVTGSTIGDFEAVMTLGDIPPETGYTLLIEASQGAAHNTWPIVCEVHPG